MPVLEAGLYDQLTTFLVQSAKFFVALVVTYVVGRAVVLPALERWFDRRGVDTTIRRPAVKVAKVVILVAAITVGLAFAGLGGFLSSVTVLASALTLAIGFAAQDVLSNFVAGVFIVSDPTFKVGSWITWDGKEGKIKDISFRVTRVRTFDNELITVPNSELTSTAITNPVAHERLRISSVFGIGYDDDIDRAEEILIEEAERIDEVMENPAPSVRLTELADSHVALKARLWVDNPAHSDFSKIRAQYLRTVKARFEEEGIDMPYPTTEITGGIRVEGGDRET